MPVYSHSRLGSFEKCPLQYRFRYVDRIKRDIKGVEAFMGQRVHEALEYLYRQKLQGRTPKKKEVLEVYHRNWKAEYNDDKVRIVRREYHAADYRTTGEICLSLYYDRHRPFDDGTTLGLEEKFEIALDPGGRHQMLGYIDRIVRAPDGAYEVHDYKTAASLPSEEDLRRDRQLTLYQMAVQERYPEAREVRLVWHFLIHGRQLTSTRSPEAVAEHRQRMIRLIEVIERARDYPARESALCRWCDYRDVCPVQKHFVLAEKTARERAWREASARLLNVRGSESRGMEQLSLLPPPPA